MPLHLRSPVLHRESLSAGRAPALRHTGIYCAARQGQPACGVAPQPLSGRLSGWKAGICAPPLSHRPTQLRRRLEDAPSRDVAQRAELIFDYCDVTGNGPLESTARSFRALALQLMRRTVAPENRSDAVRGVICMTYMIEICLWVVITVALPAMVTDPTLAFFTEAQTGIVLAAGTFGSVIGKIVAGLVMDSVHPLYAMIVIMISVAAANAAFTLGNSVISLALLWCLGRIVHASGWVAATRLICSWTPEELRGASLGALAFSARIGFMAGGALLGLMLLKGYNWQALFYAVSAAAVAQSAILFALVPADAPYSLSPATEDASDSEESSKLNSPEKSGVSSGTGELADDAAEDLPAQVTPEDASQATTRGEAVQDFVSSPQVWMAVLARCLLHVVYEFQAFLNLFAKQALGLSSGMAAQVAAGFSAGSAIAVLAGGFLFCRLQGGGRRNLTFVLCMMTAASFVGLLAPGIPAWATVALVFLLGASVSVPYYVPLPAFNIRRGGSFSAVLEGATETGAFGAAMLFDLLVGKMLAPGGAGWPGVLKVLLGAAIAAAVVTTIFMEQERRLEVATFKAIEEGTT
jgi:sugar phosphate permease